jgi:spore coat polysaccharide biosynthesis protein SpsF
MKVAAIIQARLGSSRLPGKVLAEVSGRPMLWHLVRRARHASRIDEVVLAVPEGSRDAPLADFAKEHRISCFRGSETDVLARYHAAAVAANADVIVRITADCPLIAPDIVDSLVERHLSSGADYTSNTKKRTYPRGLDAEVFNFSGLAKAHREAVKEYEREHVTPYFYQHPELFRLESVEAGGSMRRPDLRLTVDTEADLKLIREIYARLYREDRVFAAAEVIALLEQHPELAAINAGVQQKGLGE